MNSSRDSHSTHEKSRVPEEAVTSSGIPDTTSSSLLEQLVYIDNFMHTNSASTGEPTPNLDIDGQLSLDLAAFADDSFVFPDEDKKPNPNSPYIGNGLSHDDSHVPTFSHPRDRNESGNPIDSDLHANFHHIAGRGREVRNNDFHDSADGPPHPDINVASLPKWPVPPGAKSSLESAGLSQNQIELLSALVAQHQQNIPPVQVPDRSQSVSTTIEGSDTVTSTVNDDEPLNDSEQDKRRRNTAASARFRIKKKMKEKQMETKIQSLNEMIKTFEGKIQQLEMENKLLKSLIIEKGSQKSEYELKVLKERARQ